METMFIEHIIISQQGIVEPSSNQVHQAGSPWPSSLNQVHVYARDFPSFTINASRQEIVCAEYLLKKTTTIGFEKSKYAKIKNIIIASDKAFKIGVRTLIAKSSVIL